MSISAEDVAGCQSKAARWLGEFADQVLATGAPIVGCTTTFEQTAFSIALLSRLKRRQPDIVTLLGGANCEGEMGTGLYELRRGVDYVFSGESETSFVRFLHAIRDGAPPRSGVLKGALCENLDDLPLCDFSDYFDQFARALPDSEIAALGHVRLPMETSRGCWWGQKHHCTFCGLNGEGMRFREKSHVRAFEEIRHVSEQFGIMKIFMVDNIMPHRYFETLLPTLADARLQVEIFYEQKANLNLHRMMLLRDAGVTEIQPGIEALSTSLLMRMKKGVSAAQNIEMLRLARALDIRVNWNMLFGFPGDSTQDYDQLEALLPLLAHLEPPGSFGHISIDRFSPYFTSPEAHGVTTLSPLPAYGDVFPAGADLRRIAYHFTGEYPSMAKSDPAAVAVLGRSVEDWRSRWDAETVPSLFVCHFKGDRYVMFDSRNLPGTSGVHFIDEGKARAVSTRRHDDEADIAWAVENKAAVIIGGQTAPLATAPRELLCAFEVKGAVGHPKRRTGRQAPAAVMAFDHSSSFPL